MDIPNLDVTKEVSNVFSRTVQFYEQKCQSAVVFVEQLDGSTLSVPISPPPNGSFVWESTFDIRPGCAYTTHCIFEDGTDFYISSDLFSEQYMCFSRVGADVTDLTGLFETFVPISLDSEIVGISLVGTFTTTANIDSLFNITSNQFVRASVFAQLSRYPMRKETHPNPVSGLQCWSVSIGSSSVLDRDMYIFHVQTASGNDYYQVNTNKALSAPMCSLHPRSLSPNTASSSSSPLPPATLWSQLVIYQAHIATATPVGTIESFSQQVSGIANSGYNCIQLLPIAFCPNTIQTLGYLHTSPVLIDPRLGRKWDMQQFVVACWRNGILVLADMTINNLMFNQGSSYSGATYFGCVAPYMTSQLQRQTMTAMSPVELTNLYSLYPYLTQILSDGVWGGIRF